MSTDRPLFQTIETRALLRRVSCVFRIPSSGDVPADTAPSTTLLSSVGERTRIVALNDVEDDEDEELSSLEADQSCDDTATATPTTDETTITKHDAGPQSSDAQAEVPLGQAPVTEPTNGAAPSCLVLKPPITRQNSSKPLLGGRAAAGSMPDETSASSAVDAKVRAQHAAIVVATACTLTLELAQAVPLIGLRLVVSAGAVEVSLDTQGYLTSARGSPLDDAGTAAPDGSVELHEFDVDLATPAQCRVVTLAFRRFAGHVNNSDSSSSSSSSSSDSGTSSNSNGNSSSSLRIQSIDLILDSSFRLNAPGQEGPKASSSSSSFNLDAVKGMLESRSTPLSSGAQALLNSLVQREANGGLNAASSESSSLMSLMMMGSTLLSRVPKAPPTASEAPPRPNPAPPSASSIPPKAATEQLEPPIAHTRLPTSQTAPSTDLAATLRLEMQQMELRLSAKLDRQAAQLAAISKQLEQVVQMSSMAVAFASRGGRTATLTQQGSDTHPNARPPSDSQPPQHSPQQQEPID